MNCGPYCKCDDCKEACLYSGLGYNDNPSFRMYWGEVPSDYGTDYEQLKPEPEPTCTCESMDLFNHGCKCGYLDKTKDQKD